MDRVIGTPFRNWTAMMAAAAKMLMRYIDSTAE
jgi:hypothetical protein